jgi:hypothetical protein
MTHQWSSKNLTELRPVLGTSYFFSTGIKLYLSSSGIVIGLKALTFERPVLPDGRRSKICPKGVYNNR